jgi:hypothetical protein
VTVILCKRQITSPLSHYLRLQYCNEVIKAPALKLKLPRDPVKDETNTAHDPAILSNQNQAVEYKPKILKLVTEASSACEMLELRSSIIVKPFVNAQLSIADS